MNSPRIAPPSTQYEVAATPEPLSCPLSETVTALRYQPWMPAVPDSEGAAIVNLALDSGTVLSVF